VAFLPPFKAKIPVSKKEIPLLGAHNENNIRAAIAVAKYFNVSDSAIKKAIKNFKPLPHRLELVGTYRGITFYDDAISTTPESTIEAIKTLTGVHTIFLGGTDRGYDFRELEKTLRKHNVKNVVLFPDSGNRILKSEKGFMVLKTASMEEAVQFAYKYTKKGSICLLSTASPSYSVWKNFEEKGGIFKKEILKYSKAN
jgi:UDP-N-acetylmuramoylalanine--D-glutamate ligase